MGNEVHLEVTGSSLDGRIIQQAERDLHGPLSRALAAAMRLAGCETDMTPNPETVAAWGKRD